MALTGNKGEWSEIYALFKLLGDGVVYTGDQNLDKIKDLFYPIIKIIRQEAEGKYDYNIQDSFVIIQNQCKETLLRLPASTFIVEAQKLLQAIRINDKTFALPQIESFMDSIYCHSLKAKSTDKIILHDYRTKINSEMGFSIKSKLGGDSTLVNASKATNFNFKIFDVNFSDKEIEAINTLNPSKNKVIERYKAIRNKGGVFVFDKVDNSTFRNNLIMLDGDLPLILSYLLLEQLNYGISKLNDLVDIITKENPLKYDLSQNTPFYSYKIKHFLTSAALGLMPAKVWNGIFDANGGYLVIKENGDIVCYHFYNRNRFEDYLFNCAYLERSGTTRHEYAQIIKEKDGTFSFKINLQIRMK